MIETGTPAPPFELPNQDGETVRLADLAGHWAVIYFYPADDTPGWTIEAREFTAELKGIESLDAVVFGCSLDSQESHKAFIAKHDLGIALLSDPDHKMMETYGAYGEKMSYGKKKIGVIRSTVIIDPDGNVAHRWKSAQAGGHAEKVRERLEKLQKA